MQRCGARGLSPFHPSCLILHPSQSYACCFLRSFPILQSRCDYLLELKICNPLFTKVVSTANHLALRLLPADGTSSSQIVWLKVRSTASNVSEQCRNASRFTEFLALLKFRSWHCALLSQKSTMQ